MSERCPSVIHKMKLLFTAFILGFTKHIRSIISSPRTNTPTPDRTPPLAELPHRTLCMTPGFLPHEKTQTKQTEPSVSCDKSLSLSPPSTLHPPALSSSPHELSQETHVPGGASGGAALSERATTIIESSVLANENKKL